MMCMVSVLPDGQAIVDDRLYPCHGKALRNFMRAEGAGRSGTPEMFGSEEMEARAGIEPTYKDLQSSA